MSPTMLPITMREKVLIAFACAEWASALTHLSALRQVGFLVPESVTDHIDSELGALVELWSTVCCEQWDREETVSHARRWLDHHLSDLPDVVDVFEEEVSGH